MIEACCARKQKSTIGTRCATGNLRCVDSDYGESVIEQRVNCGETRPT
jgi:hypothetical protein